VARTRSGELTAEDLVDLAASVAAGRRRTLWLREPLLSLGLPAATSARVVSVAGTTVTVRPKGVDDDVPFEARELASSRAAATAPPARPPRVPRVRRPDTPATAAVVAAPAPTPPRAPRPRRRTSVTVLLSGRADGGWTVEHALAGARPSRPAPVSPEAVARAVRALGHRATGEAVDAVLEHARAAAQAQVAELTAQLERARAELEALGG
jgi:hypothetical protein